MSKDFECLLSVSGTNDVKAVGFQFLRKQTTNFAFIVNNKNQRQTAGRHGCCDLDIGSNKFGWHAQGQSERKSRTEFRVAEMNRDGAAMRMNNTAYDRQSETAAAVASAGGHVGLIKLVKDVLGFARRDADTLIGNIDDDLLPVDSGADVNESNLLGRLFIASCVVEQIDEDLRQSIRIHTEELGIHVDMS